MLSILIPCYDTDVTVLVRELHSQATRERLPFEILISDDASKSLHNEKNRSLNDLENVYFHELDENKGLSNNRNTLIGKSCYEHLLLIDGDSTIRNNKYFRKYIDCIRSNISDIVYGGREHPATSVKSKKLRATYARMIEEPYLTTRKKKGFKSLHFNNTLIKKTCFDRYTFDATIRTYGHEDTLLAYQLSTAEYHLEHIENPVFASDIDDAELFISKTEQGLKNLSHLYCEKLIPTEFVRLLTYYSAISVIRLNLLLGYIFPSIQGRLKKYLILGNPNMTAFAFYKLLYFCHSKDVKRV